MVWEALAKGRLADLEGTARRMDNATPTSTAGKFDHRRVTLGHHSDAQIEPHKKEQLNASNESNVRRAKHGGKQQYVAQGYTSATDVRGRIETVFSSSRAG